VRGRWGNQQAAFVESTSDAAGSFSWRVRRLADSSFTTRVVTWLKMDIKNLAWAIGSVCGLARLAKTKSFSNAQKKEKAAQGLSPLV